MARSIVPFPLTGGSGRPGGGEHAGAEAVVEGEGGGGGRGAQRRGAQAQVGRQRRRRRRRHGGGAGAHVAPVGRRVAERAGVAGASGVAGHLDGIDWSGPGKREEQGGVASWRPKERSI